MFIPSKEQIALIRRLNADVRYYGVAQTYVLKNDKPVLDTAANPGTFCEVQDRETGEWYCSAQGADESEALTNALNKAIHTPKPMTKAQKAAMVQVETAVQSKEAEIEAQRKEIEALRNELARAKEKKGRFGRPIKQEETATETAA